MFLGGTKMKKFSVLLVAILALMMLFVSCENEPKERVATMKDAEIVFGLISYAEGEPVTGTKEVNEDGTIKFTEAVYKDEEDNVVAVLNGTMTEKFVPESKTLTQSVDFGDGTKYKGKDHTLLANVVINLPTVPEGNPDVVSYKIKLDDVILTDFVIDFFI